MLGGAEVNLYNSSRGKPMVAVTLTPGQIKEINDKLVRAGFADHIAIQRLLEDAERFRQFVDLLRADGSPEIPETIAEAKTSPPATAPLSLPDLFESQLKRLADRGCPQDIVRMFECQREKVLENAASLHAASWYIPFLPVVPLSYLSVYSQMAMVIDGTGGRGSSDFPNGYQAIDAVDTPGKPYYIFTVENGGAMLAKAPQDAERLVDDLIRRGLITPEIISLCIHTKVLREYGVIAVKTRSPSLRVVYGIWTLGSAASFGKAWLGRHETNYAGHSGAASCDRLIVTI